MRESLHSTGLIKSRAALTTAFIAAMVAGGSAGAATQKVFLDFDTFTAGADHVYTAAEKTAILANITADYSGFDFSFSNTAPAGAFTTIRFNDGGAGGLAQEIDFRNLNLTTFAQVNINGLIAPAAPSASWIGLTSTVGAHELGHTVGLRHSDAMGPIGKGITTPPGAGPYLPDYPGPTNLAVESGKHIMASPASVGQTIAQATADTYFDEREVTKLKFIETGSVIAEQAPAHNTIATAQNVALGDLGVVPNKLQAGDENFGKVFDVDAVTVTGTIAANTEIDLYSFAGTQNQLFNFEVMSKVLTRFGAANDFDSEIRVLDAAGNPVAYYTGIAHNQDEFESFDSTLIDLKLPTTGTYYVEVSSDPTAGSDFAGKYELFFYSFAVPEPGAMMLIGVAAFLVARRRVRR